MRVALVSFAFGEYSIRLASALSEHAEVGLWLTEEQAAPHLGRLDPRVDFRPFHKPRMRQPVQQIPAMGRLIRQIRQFQPDIVHIQQGYLWFNPLLVFLRGFPSITTIHDPLPHLGDRLGKKTPQAIADMVYRGSSAIIVHNDEMRDVVADRAVIRDIHVVPHPILGDVEIFGDVTEDGATVLFFGRIWPYKGLEYLIQAEPLIAAQVPDVRIIIAGAGEDFSRYRDLMVHPDRFEVHNQYIPSGTTAELFRRSSVVALPYVEATQSGVIPMAYNFAKPVVATTVGGLPSMVDDGETGYLVAPRDVPALAEAIVRILKNPGLGAELGARGKHKVETDFSAEAVAAQTMAVYRDVAENG